MLKKHYKKLRTENEKFEDNLILSNDSSIFNDVLRGIELFLIYLIIPFVLIYLLGLIIIYSYQNWVYRIYFNIQNHESMKYQEIPDQ